MLLEKFVSRKKTSDTYALKVLSDVPMCQGALKKLKDPWLHRLVYEILKARWCSGESVLLCCQCGHLKVCATNVCDELTMAIAGF